MLAKLLFLALVACSASLTSAKTILESARHAVAEGDAKYDEYKAKAELVLKELGDGASIAKIEYDEFAKVLSASDVLRMGAPPSP